MRFMRKCIHSLSFHIHMPILFHTRYQNLRLRHGWKPLAIDEAFTVKVTASYRQSIEHSPAMGSRQCVHSCSGRTSPAADDPSPAPPIPDQGAGGCADRFAGAPGSASISGVTHCENMVSHKQHRPLTSSPPQKHFVAISTERDANRKSNEGIIHEVIMGLMSGLQVSSL